MGGNAIYDAELLDFKAHVLSTPQDLQWRALEWAGAQGPPQYAA